MKVNASLVVDAGFASQAVVGVSTVDSEKPVGYVSLAGLNLSAHKITPHDFANGLRSIAKQLDAAYNDWLTERRSVPCEVCEGKGSVMDPNQGDIDVPCPECHTAEHIRAVAS